MNWLHVTQKLYQLEQHNLRIADEFSKKCGGVSSTSQRYHERAAQTACILRTALEAGLEPNDGGPSP